MDQGLEIAPGVISSAGALDDDRVTSRCPEAPDGIRSYAIPEYIRERNTDQDRRRLRRADGTMQFCPENDVFGCCKHGTALGHDAIFGGSCLLAGKKMVFYNYIHDFL